MKSHGCWLLLAAALMCLTTAGRSAGQQRGERGEQRTQQTQSFRMSVDATIGMEIQGQPAGTVKAQTSVSYSFKRDGKETAVILNSLDLSATENGALKIKSVMNRERFAHMEPGQNLDYRFEDAPAQLKELLTQLFDTPLCVLELDDTGKELKRTVIAGAAAKPLIEESGMVDLSRMFHVPFPKDKERWQAPITLFVQKGVMAKGELTYEKAGKNAAGQYLINVSGTVTDNGKNAGNEPAKIKNAKYVFKGQQTYDPTLKEWVAGELTVDVDFVVIALGIETLANGTMKIKLEQLPGR